MRNGEYSVCRNIMDKAFFKIKLKQIERKNKETNEEKKAKIETDPMKIFLTALDNCKPLLKVIPVSRGGITYQCPVPMTDKEREFKAMKLLMSTCLDKEKHTRFYDALAREFIDAYLNQGKTVKKKIEIHKLAEANRAYAHYRWGK